MERERKIALCLSYCVRSDLARERKEAAFAKKEAKRKIRKLNLLLPCRLSATYTHVINFIHTYTGEKSRNFLPAPLCRP